MNDLDPRNNADKRSPDVLNREVFYAGQVIVRQGEEGARAFYIDSGRVEVVVKEGPHELKVAELGAGELFGEMSLITKEKRSATVRAIVDTSVSVISKAVIEGYLDGMHDKATRKLVAVLAERLKDSTQAQMRHYKSLAEFQDRVTGMVDRVHVGVDESKRAQFRKDVEPLLADLQSVLDRYAKGE